MNDEHRRFLLSILNDAANAKVYADWLEENRLKGGYGWRRSRTPKTLAFRRLIQLRGEPLDGAWQRSRWLTRCIREGAVSRSTPMQFTADGAAEQLVKILHESFDIPSVVADLTQIHTFRFKAVRIRDAWFTIPEQPGRRESHFV